MTLGLMCTAAQLLLMQQKKLINPTTKQGTQDTGSQSSTAKIRVHALLYYEGLSNLFKIGQEKGLWK